MGEVNLIEEIEISRKMRIKLLEHFFNFLGCRIQKEVI